MSDRWFVVHGHFYQPPRENPWTETVPVEASATPFHDWNERITAECYRPNAYARIVDDHGLLVAIVDNYRLLSFNAGPTLLSWLERHHPHVYTRIIEAGRDNGAIAQAYNHSILPLASPRDIRTQVRWGLADFEHRFGRRAVGLWLPETAANDAVLAVLAEEGVAFTILAPNQAVRVRPIGGTDHDWVDVSDGAIDTTRAYRWVHPAGDGRGVDVVFYQGALSHDIAFGLAAQSSQAIVARAEHALVGHGGGLVCAATDGETFGHHHKFTDRSIAYALAVEAPRAGLRGGSLAAYVAEQPPRSQVVIRESAWSCAHGVERWRSDCGCSTGGEPGWNQRWRAPLRAALDLLADHAVSVFEQRGQRVMHDPWAARDAYLPVVLGVRSPEDFAAEWFRHLDPDSIVEALTLLEAQRHSMLMFTSCGWFFNDVAGLESLQVLRYAARLVDLLEELGEPAPIVRFLALLEQAVSNDPDEGTGRDLWHRRVEPSRVTATRVAAHLALVELLERRDPEPVLGGFDVILDGHGRDERLNLQMCRGRVRLVHRRTRRTSEHLYVALSLGGLEVVGSARETRDRASDDEALAAFAAAFASGERVSELLRLMAAGFGPLEFGLESALPDAAHQILDSAAHALTDRFGAAFDRLYGDHRATFEALATARYPLPAELRLPAEMALAHRLEADLVSLADEWQAPTYRAAVQLAEEARGGGLRLASPAVVAALGRAVEARVRAAVEQPSVGAVEEAVAVLRLGRLLDFGVDLGPSQELVYTALVRSGDGADTLHALGRTLGLAVDRLGVPH